MNMLISRPGRLRAALGVVAGGAAALSLTASAQAAETTWTDPTPIEDLDNGFKFRLIDVEGVEGTVTDVDVELLDVHHEYPKDMDIMLYAPGGRRVVLLSDGCASEWHFGVDLTVDQDAAKNFPAAEHCVSGAYRPANYDIGPADVWSAEPTATSLDTLNGINPNGVWSLEFRDDDATIPASMLGGWKLKLETTIKPQCNGQLVDVDLAKGEKPTAESDVIRGTAGDDIINGFGGDDVLCGLGGNDIIQGGAGTDVMIGGAGEDTASYASSPSSVTVALNINEPQYTGTATSYDTLQGFENLRGGADHDNLYGNGLGNDLAGLGGNDKLWGWGGADQLVGGAGTDQCHGGVGAGVDTAATCETVVYVP